MNSKRGTASILIAGPVLTLDLRASLSECALKCFKVAYHVPCSFGSGPVGGRQIRLR